ncbi:dihydrodipicolinate synthase family protein [Pontibacter mangrovi]|uniref:Dihydrodipicolinate synthetase n=1 Tax=Pontibacter mangrovi TaxID=2589816 RepID=A0A501W530_9BACT|nr:dihydrodipicolinate synthase family protein [Pontibacter mangrovi]TPE43902.1 dihydrodipicolinate synthetase [Pontibacter mangrovi]
MKSEHLQGLIAAPFTPMHPDGSLNLKLIPTYYSLLKANGNTGAFICGSTGEGVSLTTAEKKQVAEAWAAAAKEGNDFKVITLVGGTCLREAVELAQHAQSIGLDAVSFTGPSYFKPASVQMLAECCKTVAGAVPQMPFYYYHIPVLTGVGFQMVELLQEVEGKIPNFKGIKYTHEDFMDYQSCLNFSDGKYDMLWGRDENLLSALAVGAKGGVGSTYNYAAPLYISLIEAYNRGNTDEARRLQQQSIDMIRLLGKYGGIATGKAYMKVVGLDCGEFRLPVRNMSTAQFNSFKEDVAALGFDEYCSRMPELKNA